MHKLVCTLHAGVADGRSMQEERTESTSSEAGRRAKGPCVGRGTGVKIVLLELTDAADDRVASSLARISETTLCNDSAESNLMLVRFYRQRRALVRAGCIIQDTSLTWTPPLLLHQTLGFVSQPESHSMWGATCQWQRVRGLDHDSCVQVFTMSWGFSFSFSRGVLPGSAVIDSALSIVMVMMSAVTSCETRDDRGGETVHFCALSRTLVQSNSMSNQYVQRATNCRSMGTRSKT